MYVVLVFQMSQFTSICIAGYPYIASEKGSVHRGGVQEGRERQTAESVQGTAQRWDKSGSERAVSLFAC